MQKFFAVPTPDKIATHIYCGLISTHESGGREYRYRIPEGMSSTFVTQVIDRLSEFLLDVDVIEVRDGCIVIDWS